MHTNKVIQIFVDIDDFIKDMDEFALKTRLLGDSKKRRNRKSQLSLSERMTIYVCFHLSSYKNFKHYYNKLVRERWIDLFPNLVSYERFNQTQHTLFIPLLIYLRERGLGSCTGISYLDSTPLTACHIKREKQHKVFKVY